VKECLSSPGKRAAILVLGAHRSGTSSLAHLLNVLGEAEERAKRQLSRVRELETVETALRDAIARLSSEAEESEAQILQMQGALSKLQAELTERSNEAERLRRQVDSIQASICWRLTWPIRWLHGQVVRSKRDRLLPRNAKRSSALFLE
jgi:hypothetical protein